MRAPWGVSESAYNARDLEFTYQYSNFGVPGLGLKTRAGGQCRDRSLRHRPGEHGRPSGRRAELPAPRGHRRARPLRFLRGAGFHAGPGPGRRARRHRARIHGPPPGHDDHRHRRRPAGRRDAQTLPRRADRSSDGAASAGARATRGHGDPAVGLGETMSAARVREIEGPGAWRKASPWSATPATQLLSNGRYCGDAHRRRVRLQQPGATWR